MGLLPKYIPQQGLKNLDSYKYSAEDRSILKTLFLGRFWEWVVTFFPSWFAPNLITLVGFLFLLSTHIIAVYYCPLITKECETPQWVYIWAAVAMFIYQTLDNVDGKQARNTQSSSPLGELFDHGCDSLFFLMNGPAWFAGLLLSPWQSFCFLTQGIILFYWSHWEEYHTNHLILGVISNPTEAQFGIMGVFMTAGIMGPTWFTTPAFAPDSYVIQFLHLCDMIYEGEGACFTMEKILELTRADVLLLLVWLGLIAACAEFAFGAWKAAIKNGDHLLAPLFRLTPHIMHVGSMFVWVLYSKYDLLEHQTYFVLLMHGILFSYLCDQIMLVRICKLPTHWYNPICLIPLAGAANVFFFETPLVDERYAMPILLTVLMIVYFYFIISVVLQLANHLNISVFTLKHKYVKKEQ